MAIVNLQGLIPKTPEEKLLDSVPGLNISPLPSGIDLTPPPPNVPRFRGYGDFLAQRGGFAPEDLRTREELMGMTQAEVDEYQRQRRQARRAGIGETLLRVGQAFQGKDATALAMQREAIRQAQQQQDAVNAAINQLNIPEAQKTLIRSLEPQQQYEALYGEDKITLTSDQKNYQLARSQGYKGTFMDYMKEKKAPLVMFDQKAETEFQKEATKSAFRTLDKARENVDQFVDIEGRLKILQKQLESGELKTGIFEELKIPFQRLAAGLNILPQDELKNLGSKELFQRTVNYIVPRMRVAGSGSTSDTEIQLFKESAPSLQLEEGGNLLIVGGMSAIAKHNRDRLKLMEKYIEDEELGNGDLIGFGEYADKKLGSVFKQYDSDESFDRQVKDGKLKAGDFVYDGIFNEFRILTDEDIKGGL